MSAMGETEFQGQGWFVRWVDLPGRKPARVFLHGMGCLGGAIFGGVAGHPRLGGHRSIIVDLMMRDQPDAFAAALDAALPG